MKKAIIVAIVLCALGFVAWVFLSPPQGHHPDYYVSRAVVSPLPATLHHVKTLYLFEPTLGDGACIAAYSVTPADFDLLLQARSWASGFFNDFAPKERFVSAWPGAPLEFESYNFTNTEWRVDMAVSKDHTKIIFSISI